MISTVNYEYSKASIEKIKEWGYGVNWPSVYVIYNDKTAYVGETLDAVRRTEEHFKELEFNQFTDIFLISGSTFNKSVILDLESFLIKYMSAEGSRKLINGNLGVDNHNYFYKETYEDDFKEIWSRLVEKGIVRKSISDIENSSLFKYSPYKALNNEQKDAAYKILEDIYKINNGSLRSLIQIEGGAGTGKTILAVYLIKLLVDLQNGKKQWMLTDNEEEIQRLKRINDKLGGLNRIGFVVPMVKLRNTMKAIFKSIDGLSDEMVISPEETINLRYDILFVDEAHRLYKRKGLPSGNKNITNIFDGINKQLMGEDFTASEDDFTELDWIIKRSNIQVIFYDENQAIRMSDIGHERFETICSHIKFDHFELKSQMRCNGGNGYYEYIKKLLEDKNANGYDYRKIDNYKLKVVDSIEELFELINDRNNDMGLCKVLTGPGWSSNDEIIIEGKRYHWVNSESATDGYDINGVHSIHKIQGFDLNYAGVIFGEEIYFDAEERTVKINRAKLRDARAKPKNDEELTRKYVLNIYLTLMTRGIFGTYIYCVDKDLRDYLKSFLNQQYK